MCCERSPVREPVTRGHELLTVRPASDQSDRQSPAMMRDVSSRANADCRTKSRNVRQPARYCRQAARNRGWKRSRRRGLSSARTAKSTGTLASNPAAPIPRPLPKDSQDASGVLKSVSRTPGKSSSRESIPLGALPAASTNRMSAVESAPGNSDSPSGSYRTSALISNASSRNSLSVSP